MIAVQFFWSPAPGLCHEPEEVPSLLQDFDLRVRILPIT